MNASKKDANSILAQNDFLLVVSTHAPARGAICGYSVRQSMYLFQFTHPRGVRWAD